MDPSVVWLERRINKIFGCHIKQRFLEFWEILVHLFLGDHNLLRELNEPVNEPQGWVNRSEQWLLLEFLDGLKVVELFEHLFRVEPL